MNMGDLITNIENELKNMTRGQKKFYQFDTQEEIDRVFKFLYEIESEMEIKVKPHVESQTGNRNIDLILVTKL